MEDKIKLLEEKVYKLRQSLKNIRAELLRIDMSDPSTEVYIDRILKETE